MEFSAVIVCSESSFNPISLLPLRSTESGCSKDQSNFNDFKAPNPPNSTVIPNCDNRLHLRALL